MLLNLIGGLISELLSAFAGTLDDLFGDTLGKMLENTLFIENYLDFHIGAAGNTDWAGAIEKAYTYLYAFFTCVLCLKLLYKGLKIYGFWRDGDADNDPKQLLVGSAWAMGTSIAFPLLYQAMAEVICTLYLNVSIKLNSSSSAVTFADMCTTPSNVTGSVVVLLIFLGVWFIMFLITFFKLLMQSFTLLIWRLGVPIAAVGLVDSDGGIWKSYLQVMFQLIASLLVQCILWKLSMRIMAGSAVLDGDLFQMVLSFACLKAAGDVPKYLSRIMIPTGGQGGSLTQTATLLTSAARLLKG